MCGSALANSREEEGELNSCHTSPQRVCKYQWGHLNKLNLNNSSHLMKRECKVQGTYDFAHLEGRGRYRRTFSLLSSVSKVCGRYSSSKNHKQALGYYVRKQKHSGYFINGGSNYSSGCRIKKHLTLPHRISAKGIDNNKCNRGNATGQI